MEVKISFDTEKDSLGEFKKLEEYIQKIIREKGGQPNVMPPKEEAKPQQPMRTPPPQQTPPPAQHPSQQAKTSGGCRVMDYKDMSKQMSDIFSGKAKRRF